MPLTANRDTRQLGGSNEEEYSIPVEANVRIFQGALVMVNAAGFATRGAAATGQIAAGCAVAEANNTGGAQGAIRVRVRPGVYGWAAAGGDAPTVANRGNTVFISDDFEVAATNGGGTRSAAGKLVAIEDGLMFVATKFPAPVTTVE